MSIISLKLNDENYALINQNEGASLTKLVLNGSDIIKFPLKADDPKKGYPSAFLFPYPNRIKDGKYEFEGKNYQLPINDTELNNAIHGLIAFKNFSLVKQSKSSVSLAYDYKGETEGFPFRFTFSVKYTLKSGDLTIETSCTNNGSQNMPCAFGWHPYFGFSDVDGLSEMEIKAPLRSMVMLDERNIPNGEKELVRKKVIPLKNTFIDNLFEVVNPNGISEIELRHKKRKIIVSQETGPDKLNFFILYIPPTRDCIAIEPQSASTNAYNNGDGLYILKPEKTKKYKFSVRLENK